MLLDRCMDMMNNMEGSQPFTYELLGVLSGLIPKQIVPHFSLIMNSLLASVKEAAKADEASEDSKEKNVEVDEDMETEDDDDDDSEFEDEDTESDAAADADTDVRDGHGDQTSVDPSTKSVSSSTESMNYVHGYDEALVCLKAFAVNMSDSMLPYLSESMERVLASTDKMEETDKWSAYETLTQFILLYQRQGNLLESKKYCNKILPAMIYFIQKGKETVNVVSVMQCIQQLLRELRGTVLLPAGYTDMVFEMLRRTLRRKLNCQVNILEEMENLQEWSQAMHAQYQVMEAANELVPLFGSSMGHREFAGYFKIIIKTFSKQLRTCPPNNEQVSRNLFLTYTMTARSMPHLGVFAEEYYDIICHIICDCLMKKTRHVRDLGIQLLDWLLTHSNEQNNAETIINKTTCIFAESLGDNSPLEKDERDVLGGILGRMIRIDSKCDMMKVLVPIFFDLTLPLHDKFESYKDVVRAIHTLHKTQNALLTHYLRETLEILLGALYFNQLPDEDTRQLAIELVKSIKVDNEFIYDQIDSKFDEAKALIV